MTYTPTIYDWRDSLVAIDQLFTARGQAVRDGVTSRGVLVANPEPGGRGELYMQLPTYFDAATNLDATWTASRIANGAIMRIPIRASVQLIHYTAITGASANGQPWSNEQPWANDENWAFDPVAPINAAASEGEVSLEIDMSDYGQILSIGHLFGVEVDGYDFTHKVTDIIYDDSDVATVTVSPPLRRDVTTSHSAKFRPKMLAQCTTAREAPRGLRSRRHMEWGQLHFVEALV